METKYQGLEIKEALMDAWDNYVLLYEGEWVVIGDSPDDGACRPTKEGRAQARNLLNNVYNHLRPYESEIMSDYERIKDTYHYNLPEGERWIRSAAYFCIEYHKQYDVSKLIGISDMMGEVFEIPAESKSDFLYMFSNNEKKAQSFLRKLKEIKIAKGELTAFDVLITYNEKTSQKPNVSRLHDVITKLNLFSGGRSTLSGEFKPNKNSKNLAEE
jgi:hypothetical protein